MIKGLHVILSLARKKEEQDDFDGYLDENKKKAKDKFVSQPFLIVFTVV